MRLLKFPDLKRMNIASSWTQVKRLREQYGMPPGRRLGPTRRWTDEEIANWYESLPVDAVPTGRPQPKFIATKAEVA